jgi:hypothetical protein
MGHIYWGLPLTYNNIGHYLAHRGQLSKGAQKTLTDLLNGHLSNLVGLANSNNLPFDEPTAALLAHGKSVAPETLASALAVAQSPEDYIWGQEGPPQSPAEAIKFALSANYPILEKSYWLENVPPKAILPKDVFAGGFNDPATYRAGAERLTRLVSEGVLTRRAYLKRYSHLQVDGIGRLRISPVNSADMATYFRWLSMDGASQELSIFETARVIDGLERGEDSRGWLPRLLRPTFWLQAVAVLAASLIPLVWALDGLDLISFTDWGVPADLVAKYRVSFQETLFYVATIILGGYGAFSCLGRARNIFFLIVFLAAGLFAMYRHNLTFSSLRPYLNWVVYGGFFLLCLHRAYRLTRAIRARLSGGRKATFGRRLNF